MQNTPQNYKDLIVWQKGIALAKAIYRLTSSFPSAEKWGLVGQMRRAAVSIPSNIAEGSTAELETQLILSVELAFIVKEQAVGEFLLVDEIRRMLNALRRKLSASS
jgi:hypothetical protein